MPVLIRTQGLSRRPVRPREVQVRAERMLKALGMAEAELSILLCDDATIRSLNRDFRAKDRPTDVLAFSQADGEPDPRGVLGDVVISLETAREQARRSGRSVIGEVSFLLAHGLLHLLGCDHRNVTETRRMSARTDALVATAIFRANRAARPVD